VVGPIGLSEIDALKVPPEGSDVLDDPVALTCEDGYARLRAL
jgi:hypothetical protein